jgi:hypothetical protein
MKRAIVIVTAAFAVALAIVVGNRMSADAMAVVVGVACGVLASVPTSLLLVWALGRRGQMAGPESQPRNGPAYPPVVVVNPGSGYGAPTYGPAAGSYLEQRQMLPPAGPRTFRVVGDEETMLDHVQHLFPGLADDWG